MYNLVIGTKCPRRRYIVSPTLDCTGRLHAWDTDNQEYCHRRKDPDDRLWYWVPCEQNPCPNRHHRPARINWNAFADEFIPVPDSPTAKSPTTRSPIPGTPTNELEVALLIALPPSPIIPPTRPPSAPPIMGQQGGQPQTTGPANNPQQTQPGTQTAMQPPDPMAMLVQSMTLLTQSMAQLAASTTGTNSLKAVQKPSPFKGEQGSEARRFLAAFTLWAMSQGSTLNHVDNLGNTISAHEDQWIRAVLSFM
ncbi:hypothetical protein DICSQDRAFT_170052 [Dichomitus squalens LYAD-421 SS1]|uniref:Uncharacterized protein n=1 Tax=Dichomitus squalens (strain LYAD-421) TaxID=732165 RepID=R7SZX5_DICSQ|nr:uncharacterized protein DICSQDRAFT_170052 [Dichomitus squalens LYAD-421 SS1]EJF61636.1 hypothetical protein DICSQDRAFT_170052 [Dichomitus squalens LYAD-421 SS1]